MANASETLYRRIQDPNYSDFRTLRVDPLGQCELLGSVYLTTPGVSRMTQVVECGGEQYVTWRDAEGRLFVDDVGARAVADAVAALESGKDVGCAEVTP